MLKTLRARLQQGYRTMRYPDGPAPDLPKHFVGRPEIDSSKCLAGCDQCTQVCPTQAIEWHRRRGSCRSTPAAASSAVSVSGLAMQGRCGFRANSAWRPRIASPWSSPTTRRFPRSNSTTPSIACSVARCRLRQVSAGGCNACEADTNVLNTVGWDLGRFGIQFVASPRHADGLLITGPVTQNMRWLWRRPTRPCRRPRS